VLRFAALGSLIVALVGSPVRATTVQDLCGNPVPDPCRITAYHAVDPGSVLDFHPGALILAANGILDAGAGQMGIVARDVTLGAGSRLLAAGGRIAVLAEDRITVDAAARIDVSATGGGGAIVLFTLGDVLVDGALRARGIGIPAFGGSISVAANGAVRLDDADASGGSQAYPITNRASVRVVAGGRVDLNGLVDASHGECLTCSIEIKAGGDLTAQKLDVHATGPSGNGGSITIESGGSIILNGDLAAPGGGGDPDFGGGGGDVEVTAHDDLEVNGSLLLGGTAPDGDGGTFDLQAGGDLRIASSSVLDAEGGGEGCGGSPTSLDAGRDLTIGRIKAGGDACGGGSLDASAGRDVTVLARITAGASAEGTGGDVAITAARSADIRADLDASGAAAGSGGSVLVEGCTVSVPAGFVIQTNGSDGSNTLLAHGLMTIAGRLEAGGANVLAFGNPASPPIITGAVVPPTTPRLDPTLTPCAGLAACGDGTRDASEECDDGNTESCDGCSATCQVELCGNGRLDCGEVCDPPDLEHCDAACQVLPQAIVTLPGAPRRNGCELEWKVELADPTLDSHGLPKTTQTCVDGDPACDADAANDGRCTIRTRVCLRAQDPRLPDCAPGAIDSVKMKSPHPLGSDDPTDVANANVLRDALSALGVTVKQGTTVLHAGVPDSQLDHCTPPLSLVVPHGARKERRRFDLGAQDVAGKVMTGNPLRLDCAPSTAVCGDGVVGIGEDCDDGNTQGCDGCSPTCHSEACGNGVIDCDEQCDAGMPNPPPATGCTAACTEAPPALRIPGGGGRPVDCTHEWALVLDASETAVDGRGVPKTTQECVDGDPRCDFDATSGTCRLHVFSCLGGADVRLGCPAASVASVNVVQPRASDGGTVHDALVAALSELHLPVGPGEACTRRVDVDVPAGRKGVVLKVRANLASGKPDQDKLKVRCLPAAP
jgi:cysteine-rich repeat protein